MGKFYTGAVIYKWSWDQVAQAFWQRYPNPYSKHVLTEDILSRHVQDNCLHTRRLLTKTNPVPRWGERFIPNASRQMCVIEESVVDPVSRTITTYTRNLAMQHVMSVEEKCVYHVSPENRKWTVCEKSAWVSSAVFGFSTAIQAFGLDRFKKNAAKASRGYEHILEKLFAPALHHQAHGTEKLFAPALHHQAHGTEKLFAPALHHQAHGTEKLKEKAIKVAQAAKAKAKAKAPILNVRPQTS